MTDLQKKRKRTPLPVQIVILSNGRRSAFDFVANNTPAEAWTWVLDMAHGVDAWQPMRVGKDLHMLPARVQWGTA